MPATTRISAIEQVSVLKNTMTKPYYPTGPYSDRLEQIIKDLLDMQVGVKTIEFGGVDGVPIVPYGWLIAPPAGSNLYDAMLWYASFAQIDQFNEAPPWKFVITPDDADQNKAKLWWRHTPTTADEKWGITAGTLGRHTGQQIRYGKNIIGIKRDIDYTEQVSSIIPVGKDGLRLDNWWRSDNPYAKTFFEWLVCYDTDDDYAYFILYRHLGDIYGAYKGWTIENGQLPSYVVAVAEWGESSPVNVKVYCVQGEDERKIKLDIAHYNPSAQYRLVFEPQPYLRNWGISECGTAVQELAMCYNYDTLWHAAACRLADRSAPRYAYTVDTIDMFDVSMLDFDLFTLGSLVSVGDSDIGIDVLTRVVSRRKRLDVKGDLTMELHNRARCLTDSLEQRLRVEGVYAESMTVRGVKSYEFWSPPMSYAYGGSLVWHEHGIDVDGLGQYDRPKRIQGLFKVRSALSILGVDHTVKFVRCFDLWMEFDEIVVSGYNEVPMDTPSVGFCAEAGQWATCWQYGAAVTPMTNGHYDVKFQLPTSDKWLDIQIGLRYLW